jgi:hypothetical protein
VAVRVTCGGVTSDGRDRVGRLLRPGRLRPEEWCERRLSQRRPRCAAPTCPGRVREGGPPGSVRRVRRQPRASALCRRYWQSCRTRDRSRERNSPHRRRSPARLGYFGDGGTATSALLYAPQAITRCGNGDLFVADTGNERGRRIDGAGLITTVVGDGTAASSGEGCLTGIVVTGPTTIQIADACSGLLVELVRGPRKSVEVAEHVQKRQRGSALGC